MHEALRHINGMPAAIDQIRRQQCLCYTYKNATPSRRIRVRLAPDYDRTSNESTCCFACKQATFLSVTLGEARLCQNHLLLRLTDEQHQPLLPMLEVVQSKLKDVIYDQDQLLRHIYFPCRAAHSNIITMEDGASIKIGTTGNEGICAIEALLRGSIALETAVCKIEGKSLRMTLADFHEATSGNTPLRISGNAMRKPTLGKSRKRQPATGRTISMRVSPAGS